VRVKRGGARFSVTRRQSREFQVSAGPVLVTVVGTEFSVELLEQSTRVKVKSGRVRVAWNEETTMRQKGEERIFGHGERDIAAADDDPQRFPSTEREGLRAHPGRESKEPSIGA